MTPDEILEQAYATILAALDISLIHDAVLRERIEYVVHCVNRSGIRVVMTCMLAKIHRPDVDVRKPYIEIQSHDAFSGRSRYDEPYITPFNHKYDLGLNPTTAFLTPAFRNINYPLTLDLVIEGRPRRMYQEVLAILDAVYQGYNEAELILQECIRLLIVRREEQKARLQSLLNEVHRASDATLPLSAETIVELLRQHLSMKHTARLPVLMIAAAYKTAEQSLNARLLPLHPHNAADEQTGALGDLEIMVQGEDQTVTVYEVKHRAVTIADLNAVLRKLARTTHKVAQYMVITTAPVDPEIDVYALSLYSVTGGTEIAVLDCLGFIRHFLHFFHRLRHEFLDVYQALVLAEPESAVDHTLKEAFLILRSNLENPLDE